MFPIAIQVQRRWIETNCNNHTIWVEAFIIGQFGIHLIVDYPWKDVFTVTHVDSGLRMADFAALEVALGFANDITSLYNFDKLAMRLMAQKETDKDVQFTNYIRRRRCHVAYIPDARQFKWYQKNTPDFLKRRIDTRWLNEWDLPEGYTS